MALRMLGGPRSGTEPVERDPGAALLNLDLRDRMNFPQRAARLRELFRVLRIEHEPPAHTDALMAARGVREPRELPRRMLSAHARRRFDHHRAGAVGRR